MTKITAVLYGCAFGVLTALGLTAIDAGLDYLKPFVASEPPPSGGELAVYIVGAIFIGPALETLLSQMAVVEAVIFRFGQKKWLAIGASTLVFALMHLPSAARVARMLFLGLAFGLIYYQFRRHSKSVAFTATLTTHTVHNILISAALLM
ncbi:CPBP family glutamic-type intramembrane protease [Duganella alba]|nr:CPBP family glutamic-type intramembrane protease [Duganella alba]